MPQGNWTCSGCGGAITELPFEPRSTSGLMCRTCHQKSKSGGQSTDNSNQGERKKFEGDWQCAGCNGSIKELPFEPRDTSNLKCRDCFIKEKAA